MVAAGLQPHRVRQFKLSKDPKFVPNCATSSGSTSTRRRTPSCSASTRKARSRRSTGPQLGLPIKKGRAGTMTHDYVRNGTTTLFAAMNVLDGTVIGQNMQRHRHQEFIRFLNAIERKVPIGKVVHVILDNYAAHKHPAVQAWLARHPRWVFHFTPTSASWLNAVEGFFAILTKRRLRRGVFRSVVDLQAAINRFLDDHNAQAKPFQSVADPDEIIAAVRRGHQALDSV
jgi:transposase